MAYAEEDGQLGIVPLVVAGGAIKLAPAIIGAVTSLFKKPPRDGRYDTIDRLEAAAKAGDQVSLIILGARAGNGNVTLDGTTYGVYGDKDGKVHTGVLAAAKAAYKRAVAAQPLLAKSTAPVATTGAPPGSPNAITSPLPTVSSASMPLLLGGGLLAAYLLSRRK